MSRSPELTVDLGGGAFKRNVLAQVRLDRLRRLRLATSLTPLYGTGATAGITPPTLTMSAPDGTSSLDGQGYSAPRIPWTNSAITYVGQMVVAGNTSPNQYYGVGINSNLGTSTPGATQINGQGFVSNVTRIRWMTDEPQIDIGLRNKNWYDLWIDGQPLYRAFKNVPPAGTSYNLNVDWGADAATYGISQSLAVAAGGSSYVIGDVITTAIGTGAGTVATIQVTGVSGGAVNQAVPVNPGAYTTVPGATLTQASVVNASGGASSGTGATFTPIYTTSARSTRKLRKYELRLSNDGKFAGLHVARKYAAQPWAATGPKFAFLGDSITAESFEGSPGGTFASFAAEYLGVENAVISGVGGTGWIAAPSGKVKLRDRLATDLYPLAPTDPTTPFVVVIAMGTNDELASTPSAVQAEVTTTIGQIIAQLPTAFLVVLGPWQRGAASQIASNQACEAAISAGCLAATGWVSRRHAFVPSTTVRWINPDDGYAGVAGNVSLTGNSGYWLSSDSPGIHPGPAGHALTGYLVAQSIHDLIQNTWAA